MQAQNEYYLEDIIEQHQRFPRTFLIPDSESIAQLSAGSVVKLIFCLSEPREDGMRGERMWVEITSRSGDDFIGVLQSVPYSLKSISQGDTVHFGANHIAAIQAGVSPLDEMLYAVITNRALEMLAVNYAEHTGELRDVTDSGWTLFFGDETDEYLSDPKNATLISLLDVLSFEPLLEKVFILGEGAHIFSVEKCEFIPAE